MIRTLCVAAFLALSANAQDSTATITGVVKDLIGQGLPAIVQLRPEKPGITVQMKAGTTGIYLFTHVPEGDYSLRLEASGFRALTIKPIHIAYDEQKSFPPVELDIGAPCGPPRIAYLHPLAPPRKTGDLRGIIDPHVAGLEVTLMCTPGRPCSSTKTDSNGEFVFNDRPPGEYSIWVSAAGFYSESGTRYKVFPGFESNYVLTVERCPRGNCRIPRQIKITDCGAI